MMSVTGIIYTPRHAFRSMAGSGSRSQDLFGDDMITFSHFSNCDWFKRCELRFHLWRVGIYNV